MIKSNLSTPIKSRYFVSVPPTKTIGAWTLQSSSLTSLRSLTTSSIISFLMVSTISTSRSFSIIGSSLISYTILISGSFSITRPSLISSKISIFSYLTSTYSSRKVFSSTCNSSFSSRIYGSSNNLNMNFLTNNNLVLYTTRFLHNPKDKIW